MMAMFALLLSVSLSVGRAEGPAEASAPPGALNMPEVTIFIDRQTLMEPPPAGAPRSLDRGWRAWRDAELELGRGHGAPTRHERRELDQARSRLVEALEAELESGSEITPWVLLTLGEVNEDLAEARWCAEEQAYSDRMQALYGDEAARAPEAPARDDAAAIQPLVRLLDTWPSDPAAEGASYLLGFLLGSPVSKQFDPVESRRALLSLVEQHPTSPLAADARTWLGLYALERRDLDEAITHFQAVVDRGTEERRYASGLYMLALAHNRRATTAEEYAQSAALFADLLDWSAAAQRQGGKPEALEPEAIQYLANALIEQARVQSERAAASGSGPTPPPMDLAQNFLQGRGAPSYEAAVLDRVKERAP